MLPLNGMCLCCKLSAVSAISLSFIAFSTHRLPADKKAFFLSGGVRNRAVPFSSLNLFYAIDFEDTILAYQQVSCTRAINHRRISTSLLGLKKDYKNATGVHGAGRQTGQADRPIDRAGFN